MAWDVLRSGGFEFENVHCLGLGGFLPKRGPSRVKEWGFKKKSGTWKGNKKNALTREWSLTRAGSLG